MRSRGLKSFMAKNDCELGYRVSALNFGQGSPLNGVPLRNGAELLILNRDVRMEDSSRACWLLIIR